MWYAAAYLGLVAVTSLVSFAAYGFDKRRAATGGRRVPERTLLVLAFLGGWPGAILGPAAVPAQDQEGVVPDRLLGRRCAACRTRRGSGLRHLRNTLY